jgi:hypothetical protein
MEASQYSELAQQLAAGTQSARGAIKGQEINDKVKAVKDFFQDSAQVLLGKQIEESLGMVKKAGGVLKSLGFAKGDVEKMAQKAGSKAASVGKKMAADAKAKIQDKLKNTKDDVAKRARQKIKGEEPEGGEGGDIPLQNMASGDVGSGAEANPVAQDGQMAVNAEREAQTTEESIARGGGSVLGEDGPTAGSTAAASQEQAALQKQTTPEPDEDTSSQQQGASEQNERNKDKEDDEDGKGEGKFERDVDDATKATEEEDVVDPAAEEASLPLTAILGGVSLIASMFTKDHHQKIIQKATAGTSFSVQAGI